MRVLVVTPTLGASPWLADTVASVAAIPRSCTHVLVAPGRIVEELRVRFPACTVIAEPTPPRGMYAAINAGTGALGEWDACTYINDDDLLLSGFVSIVDRVAAGGNAYPLLVYGRVRLVGPAGRRLGTIPVSRFPRMNRALYAERLEPVYQHGTVVSRAAWDHLGGYDPAFRLCGDSELLARACVLGVPTAYVPADVAAFRLRSGQLTKDREAMLGERQRVDAKLGLIVARRTVSHRIARLVFRGSNMGAYLERMARFGFRTFDEVLAFGGREEPPAVDQS